MPAEPDLPIACSLQGQRYEDRLASNLALARRGLISHHRDGLRLTLTYSADVAADVREMVALERRCCAFLEIGLQESPKEIEVILAVPSRAAGVADEVFAQFVPADAVTRSTKAASITLLIGAAACGICCLVPIAWPAVAAAGAGGALIWFGAGLRRALSRMR